MAKQSNSGYRWLFLISFLASLAMCVLLGFLLVFFVGRHDPRMFRVAIFVVPQLAILGWVAGVMWRAFTAT